MRTCRKRTEHSCQRRGGRRRGNRPALTDAGDTGRGGHRTDERTALLMHEPTGFALLRRRRSASSACGGAANARDQQQHSSRAPPPVAGGDSATRCARCGGCTPRSSPQVRSASAACVRRPSFVLTRCWRSAAAQSWPCASRRSVASAPDAFARISQEVRLLCAWLRGRRLPDANHRATDVRSAR